MFQRFLHSDVGTGEAVATNDGATCLRFLPPRRDQGEWGTARNVLTVRYAPDSTTSGDWVNSGPGRRDRRGAKAGRYASRPERCR